jgi:hypothetical protein
MPVTYSTKDLLPHIAGPKTLAGRVVATSACITLLSVIEVCWRVTNDEIILTATLKTPLGNIPLGEATLSAANNTATLSGSIDGFKAEVTITLNIAGLSLEICGKACAFLAGCAEGCTTISL